MCIFCKIAQGKDEKTTLLYQDDEIMVFRDIRPATEHHYLVCPKEHIKDAKTLSRQHLPLVERLVEVGKQVVSERGGDIAKARLGFHWPPFHAVAHLHLHVITPESEMGFIARGIFKPNSWWFVTVEWLIERLKNMKDSEEDTGKQ